MSAAIEDLERRRVLGIVIGAVNSPATTEPFQQGFQSAAPHPLQKAVYYVSNSLPIRKISDASGYGRVQIHEGFYDSGTLAVQAALRLPHAPITAIISHYSPCGPFDQLKDGKVAAAKALIDRWMQDAQVSAAIESRLRELVDMAGDEYPDTEIPGVQMLESALSFFRSRRDIRAPSLTLTSRGHLWAQWRLGPEYAAAIEFRRDGSANLAAFFPDPEEPLRPASVAGNYSWKAASSEIRRNPALSWLLAG